MINVYRVYPLVNRVFAVRCRVVQALMKGFRAQNHGTHMSTVAVCMSNNEFLLFVKALSHLPVHKRTQEKSR